MTAATSRAALQRAIGMHQAGDLAGAEHAYRETLAADPDCFPALHWLGVILAMQGRLDAAQPLLARAITVNVESAQAFSDHGSVLKLLRRHDEALASYDRALALDANLAQAWSNRGIVLHELHRYVDALASHDRALAAQPGNAHSLTNRGATLAALGRYEEAVASCTRALAIAPGLMEALENRGVALAQLGRYAMAVDDFGQALASHPDRPFLRGQLLHAQMYCCEWKDFAGASAKIVEDVRAGLPVVTPFAFLAMADSPGDQLACVRIWARAEALPSAAVPATSAPHDRIRLAYISGNFGDHALAYLLAGTFEGHDRTRFETTAMALGPAQDGAMRTRLQRAFDHFVDAGALSDGQIVDLLRAHGIDIAVDLDGWTGGGRTRVFALRAAPIQVSYLGYPGTMGIDCIDYVLADRFVIPEAARHHYSERVVYLPDTFQANDAARLIAAQNPTRSAMGLPAQGFVYCSFNSPYKITPRMFDVWMRVLGQRQDSVLWLLGGVPSIEGNLRREARARGVDSARLVFAPRIRHAEYLARYRLADLFLDTLPFNAGTTASDALWAGLPVLTCPGEAFAARMAGSLLQALGMPELIASSLEAYESMAVMLAADASLLAGIRRKLAVHRDRYPAFDTARFCRHLEAAYGLMWERHQRGEPPAGFAVPPIAATPA